MWIYYASNLAFDFNYYIEIRFSNYQFIIMLLIEELIIYLLCESNEWFDGVEDVYSWLCVVNG
jgi:hypothetical protein